MERLISIQVELLEEGDYLATSEDFPGLIAQGRTIAETMEIAQDVARKLIESYIEHGTPLPSALRPTVPNVGDLQQLSIPVAVEFAE